MQTGGLVADFTATDQHGAPVRLSELLAAGAVVLFFYPKAMSMGCTKESCHFRDLSAELAEVDAVAVGVSADSVDDQARFDERHSLGMPLLSDPDRSVARQFGVARRGPLPSRRATFVIGRDSRLLAEISSEVLMDRHADRAIEVLREAARPVG